MKKTPLYGNKKMAETPYGEGLIVKGQELPVKPGPRK
jgi:hypothetical protein